MAKIEINDGSALDLAVIAADHGLPPSPCWAYLNAAAVQCDGLPASPLYAARFHGVWKAVAAHHVPLLASTHLTAAVVPGSYSAKE
ncbi:hypothetical protein ACFFLM_06250 [Deinococcus oregonensis]|uniref:Uncharacterized protein n=1 Tax=Deinococcus oregonensis TaxID=1805970 RepID=A0ABV6AX50_9DEIO